MGRYPNFQKANHKLCQQDLMKNIWCPFYEDCLYEAADLHCLLDCSQCENANVNFEEDWRNRNVYCLL
ncbi:uncharacterized protein Dvar_21990 [Desulfosarcina variabilis str. Montpellier]